MASSRMLSLSRRTVDCLRSMGTRGARSPSLAAAAGMSPTVTSSYSGVQLRVVRTGLAAEAPSARRGLSTAASEAAAAPAGDAKTRSDVSGPSLAPEPVATGEAEQRAFQAETKQLLNIVTHSLYTDKHVFLRELVSNASDACERLRARMSGSEGVVDPSLPLGIHITTDEAAGVLTIADSGIGMTRTDVIDNLGTIARSGSKAFLAALAEKKEAVNIIGQFGVGFYSVFMVSDDVRVYTRTAVPDAPEPTGLCWHSSGDGSYDIREASGVTRGSRVVIRLREADKNFALPATVKDILTRYSNFVNFPIYLNGTQVNTVGALWMRGREDITDAQYTEFYKYKSGDFDAPLYRLHFNSDAPIALKALLFVGRTHEEKYGMGRIKPGVDLYSRRVLIEPSSRIMPDWLRFVHGVVDSEDIPLNVSRETMQDSALVKRLRSVLTRRLLRFFEAEARRDAVEYNTKFFMEFGQFLKEGAVTDAAYSADIAKLLRFESSAHPAGTLTSLDEYVSRMSPGQKSIYYLVAPHRGIAEASPYMEAFRGRRSKSGDATAAAGTPTGNDDVEVLFLYSSIDDFVMNNVREFNGRKLVTAETAELNPDTLKGVDGKADAGGAESTPASTPLTTEQVDALGTWLVAQLPKRISKVRATTRLKSSPAVVTEHESAAVRRMMRLVEQSAGRDSEALRAETHMLPPQTLEVNPAHPVIISMHAAMTRSPALASLAAEQLLDNALIAAGLVEDARTMLPRLNALLQRVLSPADDAVLSGVSSADLAAKRHEPASETSDKLNLKFGEAMYAEVDAEMRKQAAQTGEAGKSAS